jgi:hypothetical protein
VSPGYPLDEALQRIDGRLINYHSGGDWIVLGLGTQIFGTMDRGHTVSAGMRGFDLAAALQDQELQQRVHKSAWDSSVAPTGHFGNHLGILLKSWNKSVVAPWLTGSTAGLPRGGFQVCHIPIGFSCGAWDAVAVHAVLNDRSGIGESDAMSRRHEHRFASALCSKNASDVISIMNERH